ncbi:MAG TPA: twin-arginine translocase subunit TatC [Planctomycetota bacterium]|nr:twin-arginine translocase subunit TatC [Planctomycetota bacterium]
MSRLEGDEDPFAHTRMSLGDHLDELRRRLVVGVGALAVAFGVGLYFAKPLAEFASRPMMRALTWINADQVERYEARLVDHPAESRDTYFVSADPAETRLRAEYTVPLRMTALGTSEGFLYQLKLAGYFAVAVGGPVLLVQMWSFVAAGLYAEERRTVTRSVPISLGLFLAGLFFGYQWMVPYGIYFLATAFTPEELVFTPRIAEYLPFLSTLTLVMGLVFQLPLVMHVVVRIGVVDRAMLVRYRSYFVVGALILAAILTPPDPYTQVLLAGPMILLYEIGLLWTRFVRRPAEREDPA